MLTDLAYTAPVSQITAFVSIWTKTSVSPSVLFGRKRKQQHRIEEFMDQHEDQPASETGKVKLHWRLRWMLFVGASVIVGTWII